MKLCSRDWQDLLDKQERQAVALEAIAQSVKDSVALAKVTNDVLQQTAKLKAAIPT